MKTLLLALALLLPLPAEAAGTCGYPPPPPARTYKCQEWKAVCICESTGPYGLGLQTCRWVFICVPD